MEGGPASVSRRQERIGSEIRRLLAHALTARISDPRIEPFTSITRVRVSPDMSVAHVHVSVMAREARRDLCLRALRGAAGRLRTIVAEQLTLRQTPALLFHLDDSVRGAFETVQAIERAMEEHADGSADAADPLAPSREDADP